MGLAIAAVVKGYKCIFTTTDKQSKEKVDALKAFGAEVIVCPTDVDPEDPRSYYSVSSRLEREVPNAWKANQYDNLSNTQAHYEQTGPEIWEQTDGRVTHLVCGVGTGGTITGVGEVLKDKLPNVHIVAVEPARSPVLGGGKPGLSGIQGIGASFVPSVLNRDIYDELIGVKDEDAIETTRRLAREEGLLVGVSAGANVWASIQVARKLGAGKRVVTVLPDTGERYLSVNF
jgi:cystathionine beta-synthase